MANPIKRPKNKLVKVLLVTIGLVSLTLGIIGIFLPLLPTTPFLILSAALFLRSSERLYNWLLNHRILGNHLKNYMIDKSISRNTKISALLLLWITILSSIFFIIDKNIVKIVLLGIALAVSIHILSFKTTKK
ncbi:MAG TPA: YbaN family protein [Bacteroidales bacterium]|nr:YbaN family protein [Bacteroidales bacterium]